MSGLNFRTIVAAAIASTAAFSFIAGAQAYDGRYEREHERERWEREHRYHHYEPERFRHEAPRVVYERQPVVVMPQPMYQQPNYQQPADPSLNFNFTIPLR